MSQENLNNPSTPTQNSPSSQISELRLAIFLLFRRQVAGFLPRRSPPEQRPLLQGGASGPGFRKQRRTTWITDSGIRWGFQVPVVVVRSMGRGSRRRQAPSDPRTAGFRAEPSQWSILAGTSGESVRQVSSTPWTAWTRDWLSTFICQSAEHSRGESFSLLLFTLLRRLTA